MSFEVLCVKLNAVTGMTRSVLPILAEFNIQAISVGVNTMTAPPDVPNPAVWKFNDSVDVMMTYHKGGYPDNPGPDPKHPGGISRKDCTIVSGLRDVLCFAFRTDNSGPPENIQVCRNHVHVCTVTHTRTHDGTEDKKLN